MQYQQRLNISENTDKKLTEDAKKKWKALPKQITFYTLVTGATFKAGSGSLFGYVSGVFSKQLSNKLIWYVGIGGSMLATLVWIQWIKVQWGVI